MGSKHINNRGKHTTVIDAALPVISFLFKQLHEKTFEVAPGKIENGVGAKSKSVKFKHINNGLYEMVVTHNGSRQEFKLFTELNGEEILSLFMQEKKLQDWNCNYTDMRDSKTI